MKKIFLCCLIAAVATASPFVAKTQAPDTSTVDKLQRYVAGPLDKAQVPTGFLEDYGAPFIPLAAFNGNLSDSNKIEMSLWRLLYFQLQTSYCQAGTNPLPGIVTVNTGLFPATIKERISWADDVALIPVIDFIPSNVSQRAMSWQRTLRRYLLQIWQLNVVLCSLLNQREIV